MFKLDISEHRNHLLPVEEVSCRGLVLTGYQYQLADINVLHPEPAAVDHRQLLVHCGCLALRSVLLLFQEVVPADRLLHLGYHVQYKDQVLPCIHILYMSIDCLSEYLDPLLLFLIDPYLSRPSQQRHILQYMCCPNLMQRLHQ